MTDGGKARGLRHAMRTDTGLVRKANEDSIIALPGRGVWAVSDGMGGHVGGCFASETVVNAIDAIDPSLGGGALMQATRDAMAAANETIMVESRRQGGVTMGATVVILVIADGYFAGLWAGDSRLYLLRGGELTMISRDHSLVSDLVDAGQLAPEDAESHPHANVITRAVGAVDALDLDKRRGHVEAGDRFLLCSDGLSRYAEDSTIRSVLAAEPLDTVTDRLVDLALAQGGADNISAIVVDVDADAVAADHSG